MEFSQLAISVPLRPQTPQQLTISLLSDKLTSFGASVMLLPVTLRNTQMPTADQSELTF